MKNDTPYPYVLEKKDSIIKLIIMSNKRLGLFGILYAAVIVMSIISVVGGTLSLFLIDDYTSKDYLMVICIIIACILFFCLALYLLLWKRKGKEIFILHPDKLETIVVIKPLKTEKHVFNFNKLEIGYQSGEDFYSEEEARLLGVELDLDKVEGNYPIQFYMDEGEQVVDSNREIPIELIKKIRNEFLLIQKETTNEL